MAATITAISMDKESELARCADQGRIEMLIMFQTRLREEQDNLVAEVSAVEVGQMSADGANVCR